MYFTRPRLEHREFNGLLPNGQEATKVVVDQTARADIILGNGTASFRGRDNETIQTVALTTSFDDNRYELNINQNGQLFVTVKIINLGAGGINSLRTLIEFQDPDHLQDDNTKFWYPSKEGVDRDATLASHEWQLTSVGTYILTSRKEPLHFTKARVSFRADAGVPDADTRVHVGWFHDGKIATVPEQ